MSPGKAVDINLASIRTRAGSRQRLQCVCQIVRVVGQRLEVLALDHQRRSVVLGLHIDGGARFGAHRNLLLLRAQRQLNGQLNRGGGAHCEGAGKRRETRETYFDRVLTRRKARERVTALGLRLRRLTAAAAVSKGNRCRRNHGAGIVRQSTLQRDRLVQTERVAAWRELARRLAHELKNPLFPLQLTVENLVRSRELPAEEFEEVFRESTQTLGMEIANLKAIIGRFSDFSKMPKPEIECIDATEVIERVRSLYATVAQKGTALRFELQIANAPMPLDVDPELLHRALSNLVLNAMDVMPEGGTLTLSARPMGDEIEIRVSDTGQGLTPEECERLFTPYYTTKQHGTGLGLAIVQSVIADHKGKIAVESRAGEGATFIITLPKASA